MEKNVWLNRVAMLMICIASFTVILSNNWKIRLAVVALIVILLVQMIRYQLKKSQVHSDELLSAYRNQVQSQNIKLAEHMRHDWLNHFQVIMGYIQLHKFDKILDFFQHIREQSHRDSALSRLEVPSLIHFFLHYRIQDSLMSVEWDIHKQLNIPNLIISEDQFAKCVIQCMDLWMHHAKPLSEVTTLLVNFEPEAKNLHITYHFAGVFDEYTLQKSVLQQIAHDINPFIDVKRLEEESKLIVKIKIPYRSK